MEDYKKEEIELRTALRSMENKQEEIEQWTKKQLGTDELISCQDKRDAVLADYKRECYQKYSEIVNTYDEQQNILMVLQKERSELRENIKTQMNQYHRKANSDREEITRRLHELNEEFK